MPHLPAGIQLGEKICRFVQTDFSFTVLPSQTVSDPPGALRDR
jgi:hypothetical protein